MLPPDPRHHQVPPLPPRAEGLRRGLLRGSPQHTLEDQVLALIKDSSSEIRDPNVPDEQELLLHRGASLHRVLPHLRLGRGRALQVEAAPDAWF